MAMIPQMSAPSYQQQTQSMNANPAYQQWQQQQAAKRASMPTTAVPPQFGTPTGMPQMAPNPTLSAPKPDANSLRSAPMSSTPYTPQATPAPGTFTPRPTTNSPTPSGNASPRATAPKSGGRTAQAQARSGRTAITPSEQLSAYQRATKSMS